MKNFIFKSTDADLHKMFSILENLQKNLVYVTYKVDAIIKTVRSLETNARCQKEADSFYDGEAPLGLDPHLPLEDNTKDIPDETSD